MDTFRLASPEGAAPSSPGLEPGAFAAMLRAMVQVVTVLAKTAS